jgi:hypothetical protein
MKAPMSSKVRMTPAPLGALELVSIGSNLNSAMVSPDSIVASEREPYSLAAPNADETI